MPSAATTNIPPASAGSNSNRERFSAGGAAATPDAGKTPHNTPVEAQEGAGTGGAPGRPDGFLTADGSRESHAVTLADGRPNPSRHAGRPYRRITWGGIRGLVHAPAAVPKHRGPFVILSTYVGPDGRNHAAQRERGAFGGLAVDIDTGNPELAQVVDAVRAVIGDAAAFVYSSASAAPDRRKWRVLVPLATPLAGADYADTQSALFELLAARGLECDPALARPGQPVYLPNVPPERRGEDGEPRFYQSARLDAPALELAGHAIAGAREAIRARRAAEDAEAAARATTWRSQQLARAEATGDTFDPIEHFNANHTVADMLARYGFERKPGTPHYRSPLSESGSYSTQDRGDHWVCLSAWAHTHNVGRTTKTGQRAGDAFDLFAAFEHDGNRSAAVRAYAADVRPWRPVFTTTPPVVPEPEPLPPPGRVEILERPPVVPVEAIREAVEDQLRWAVTARPALAVLRAGTAAAKTTTAVRVGAETPGRVVWNVGSHAAAAQVVAMHHAAGHMDAAAIPPRDETTCGCWTDADAKRLAEEHGGRPGLSMQRAMAVGMPMLACSQCPLSGMNREHRDRAAQVAERAAELELLADSGWDVQPLEPPADASCEYWRRTNHALAQRVLVQCQQRTERQPHAIEPEGWETVTVFTDENALGVLQPRAMILPEEVAAVAEVLRAAGGNHIERVGKMRFGEGRARAYELARWAEAVAKVADAVVATCTAREATGTTVVEPLTTPAVDPETVPRAPHRKLLALLAVAELPAAFTPHAFELCRLLAVGEPANATLRVAADAGGTFHASIHRSWALELDPRVAHVVMDATVDVEALKRIRPDAVVLDPPGAAARVHAAEQWWVEINPRTAPAVVVDTIERVLDAKGWNRAALMLCKAHRDVLFPVTRPRRGVPEDKPANVEAIAKWHGGRVSATEASTTARKRAAEELAARVARICERLARDANGNVLVDHHRGTRSRGSNAFMADAGVDGMAVIGHTRTNPVDIVGHLLATGMADAVAAGDGAWGDVEGEVPTVEGTTRRVRWRGYACPHWAAAARAINRADLEQTAARARPNLDTGVPVLVAAAEPCGLPLADPPARLPAGVAAVVEAVRRLTGEAGNGVAQIATGGPGAGETGGGESGQRSIGHGEVSRQRSIGHTPDACLRERCRDTPGAPLAAIMAAAGLPERATQRALADAMAMGLVARHGSARATRYAIPAPAVAAPVATPTPAPPPAPQPPPAQVVPQVADAPPQPPPPRRATLPPPASIAPDWWPNPAAVPSMWPAPPPPMAAPPPVARAGPCAA